MKILRHHLLLMSLGLTGAAGAVVPPVPAVAPRQVVAQQALGKLLFYEPALSVNGKRSCASCHRPEKDFTDQRGTSRALRFTGNLTRNAPTLLNAAGQSSFFHDGRAGSLADVVESVLTHPDEFGSSYALVAQRLGSSPEYRRLFRQAFGAPVVAKPTVDAALVAYMRTLTATASAYDQAKTGGAALPAPAAAGEALFATAGCGNCHGGPQFRDGQRHEVRPGQWVKTPTLRNVARTMPYRADGGAATLAAVLTDDYHRPLPAQPLSATAITQLTAFLEALTDTTSTDRTMPLTLPRLRALPARTVGGQY